MTEHRKDAGRRALRTWLQGLAATVTIAAWPILSELATAQTWEGVEWSTVGNGLRYSVVTAGMSYVWRTVLDPRAEARSAKRVAGYLTADESDRDEGGE
jgi:hypothetical protein